MSANQIVVVVGGAGQLGAAVIDAFNVAGYSTLSIDINENGTSFFPCTPSAPSPVPSTLRLSIPAVGSRNA